MAGGAGFSGKEMCWRRRVLRGVAIAAVVVVLLVFGFFGKALLGLLSTGRNNSIEVTIHRDGHGSGIEGQSRAFVLSTDGTPQLSRTGQPANSCRRSLTDQPTEFRQITRDEGQEILHRINKLELKGENHRFVRTLDAPAIGVTVIVDGRIYLSLCDMSTVASRGQEHLAGLELCRWLLKSFFPAAWEVIDSER